MVEIDGQPWFVAADVCRILGIGWDKTNKVYAPSRIAKHLNEDENASNRIANPKQNMLIISESGLYKLIIRSDKPAARAFQDWVTRSRLATLDVLLAIRKAETKQLLFGASGSMPHHCGMLAINPTYLWTAIRPIHMPLTCTHHAKTLRNYIRHTLVQQTRTDPSRLAQPQAWPEEEREGLG